MTTNISLFKIKSEPIPIAKVTIDEKYINGIVTAISTTQILISLKEKISVDVNNSLKICVFPVSGHDGYPIKGNLTIIEDGNETSKIIIENYKNSDLSPKDIFKRITWRV